MQFTTISSFVIFYYIYITKQRDIYDTAIFRFLQIFYGLTVEDLVSP